MSISTTLTKHSYDGNNSITTKYPIDFRYLEDTHVSVYFDGVLQQRGAGADYVLAGDGTINTGYITTNVAQPATVKVTIVLDVPFDQPVELLETGVLSADTLEEAYDRLNMQIRRVWRRVQGAITFGSDEGGSATIGTANSLLAFDDTGNLDEIPNDTFLVAENNLSDVDAAAARANLGVDASGTDVSTDVTLTGSGTYLSIAGQVITVDPLTESDVSDLGSYIENVTGSPLSELQDVTITTPSSGEVLSWNGSAWVNTAAGTGDMVESVYDPNAVSGDAFDMDNMVEGSTNKILTTAERSSIGTALQASDINTLSELNTILTDATLDRSTDQRPPLAHSHAANEISNFDAEVANNSAVALNTAKVSNATHTGDVTGSTTLTIADGAVEKSMFEAGQSVTNPIELGVVDLDDYRTAGFYWQRSNTAAGTGSNYPEAITGRLVVEDGYIAGASNGIIQRYTTANADCTVYVRCYFWNGAGNEWTAWKNLGAAGGSNATHTGDVTGSTVLTIADGAIDANMFALGQSATRVAALPASADLNDYKTAGYYRAQYNSVPSGGTNYPVTTAGNLRVEPAYGTNGVVQTYTESATGDDRIRATYQRVFYGNTGSEVWYPWTLIGQRDLVHVKDFGAVGDGVTDDTIALNNAISSGRTVQFEDGKTYLVTGVIGSYANDVNVTYEGNGAKIKFVSALGGTSYAFEIGRYSVVRNLNFDFGTLQVSRGMRVRYGSLMENFTFTSDALQLNSGSDAYSGILLIGDNITLRKFQIHNWDKGLIVYSDSTNYTTIEDFEISGFKRGIDLWDSGSQRPSNVSISKGRFHSISVTASSNLSSPGHNAIGGTANNYTLSDIVVEEAGEHGIYIPCQATYAPITNVAISNVLISNCGSSGFKMRNVKNATVSGVSVTNIDLAGNNNNNSGALLMENCENVMVTGFKNNKGTSAAHNGVEIDSCNFITLSDILIEEPSGNGLYVTSSAETRTNVTNVHVNNLMVMNPSGHCIYVDMTGSYLLSQFVVRNSYFKQNNTNRAYVYWDCNTSPSGAIYIEGVRFDNDTAAEPDIQNVANGGGVKFNLVSAT